MKKLYFMKYIKIADVHALNVLMLLAVGDAQRRIITEFSSMNTKKWTRE